MENKSGSISGCSITWAFRATPVANLMLVGPLISEKESRGDSKIEFYVSFHHGLIESTIDHILLKFYPLPYSNA